MAFSWFDARFPMPGANCPNYHPSTSRVYINRRSSPCARKFSSLVICITSLTLPPSLEPHHHLLLVHLARTCLETHRVNLGFAFLINALTLCCGQCFHCRFLQRGHWNAGNQKTLINKDTKRQKQKQKRIVEDSPWSHVPQNNAQSVSSAQTQTCSPEQLPCAVGSLRVRFPDASFRIMVFVPSGSEKC